MTTAFLATSNAVVLRPLEGGVEAMSHQYHRRETMPFPSTTTTQLSMVRSGGGNLMDRFSRVVRGNVNRFVASLEAPDKVIGQTVVDMQNDLVKLRTSQSEVKAAWQRSLRKQQQVMAEADQWYQRAQLALRQDEESLARQALTKRSELIAKSEALKASLEGQAQTLKQLDQALNTLEQHIRQAQSQKNQLLARAKTAKTTLQVNEMLSTTVSSALTGSKNSMAAFLRMQERVEAMEAAAEASSINRLPEKLSDDLEIEFQLLEAQSTVDLELEQLKRDLVRPASLPLAKQPQTVRSAVRLPSSEKREVIRIPVTTKSSSLS